MVARRSQHDSALLAGYGHRIIHGTLRTAGHVHHDVGTLPTSDAQYAFAESVLLDIHHVVGAQLQRELQASGIARKPGDDHAFCPTLLGRESVAQAHLARPLDDYGLTPPGS